jgi:hypothetical protein
VEAVASTAVVVAVVVVVTPADIAKPNRFSKIEG